MASDGVYILNTSEYLSQDAVEKFNIPIIDEGAVILSFKMTVGRVKITDDKMLSNEAIAQFIVKDEGISISKKYLYLFLLNFNYDLLGSTSSIVTSINTRIIGEILINIPDRETGNNV